MSGTRGARTNSLGWSACLLIAVCSAPSAARAVPQAAQEVPRSIRVTMDDNYPPFAFTPEGGSLQGILIDSWKAWEQRTGIAVEIHAVDWAQALQRMSAGEFDVIDTIFDTPERRRYFDFTAAYASIEVPIFFRNELSGITDIGSLRGFLVAAKTGDNAVDLLERAGVKVFLFPNYEAIAEAAKEHKVNIFVVDAPPGIYFLNKLGIEGDFRRSDPVYVGAFHRAVRKGNTGLLEVVERGFADVGREELERIDEKWLGRPLHGMAFLTYAGYAAGLALLVVVGLGGWNRSLRSKIQSRTAALQESEQRFRQLAENIHEVFWLTDPAKQEVLYVSPAFEDIWGYTCDALLAAPSLWLDSVHPDDRERVRRAAKAHAHGPCDDEYRIVRADGSTCWIRDRAFPVRDAAGDVYRIAGVAEDISERKRTAEDRKASERRFREMLENVELIAMTLDMEGRVTFCNEFLLRLTGWKREEVIGYPWFDLFLPDSAAGSKEVIFDTGAIGRIPPYDENPIKTRTGGLREIVWSNTLLRDGAGEIVGTASIGEDVTERSRGEAALRESELQFRQVVETIREVYWIIEVATGRMLYVSPGYETIWGRSCQSLYADPSTWTDSILPEDRERVREATLTEASGGYDETYRIMRPDGSVRWIRDRGFPIRGPAGEVQRVVGTAEDVTENRTLEVKLRQAHKMEAIGQLAGGIAHDFNNILACVMGYTELALMETAGNEELKSSLQQVLGASQRAKELVRRILAFSRPQESERKPIELQPGVNEALKLVRALLPSTIEIQSEIGARVPAVLADATQIHQIILNLATNAAHAMGGRGKLGVALAGVDVDAETAKLHPSLHAGSYAVLSVSDTGCGMDAETQRHLFEPFFTTKPVGEGTGLGLPVVHGIVKSHDGAIIVTSEPGRGSLFQLYFPADAREVAPAAAPSNELLAGNGEHILVVDDEPSLAVLSKKILELAGYRVTWRTSALEALAAFRADPSLYDMVITDLTMPGMNGVELASQLLRLRPDVPIVLVTGNDGSMSSGKAQSLGLREVLSKPATASSLTACTQRVLAGPGAV